MKQMRGGICRETSQSCITDGENCTERYGVHFRLKIEMSEVERSDLAFDIF